MGLLDNIKIGVLGGGISSEREISLISAQEAYKVFQGKKFNVVFLDISTQEISKVKEMIIKSGIDLAFIALHGEFGEDGKIQKILDDLGLAYTGSGSLASYLAMDKIISKEIFINRGIPTANFRVYDSGIHGKEHLKAQLFKGLNYPLVVKPYFAGSSVGVSIARNEVDLEKALLAALSLQPKVVIEDYIKGREFTVGILEEKALAVVEIITKTEYFDFTTKYSDGLVEFVAPARLEPVIYNKIQSVALAAHKALGCRHFSRVDVLLDKNNVPNVLEVNSIPGLTPHSLLPLSAKCCGMNFDELILKMASLALDGQKYFKEVSTN
ncbi:MAG: D-alanine--D-alanine ligase [Candidatus Omnitrophota bacterium]